MKKLFKILCAISGLSLSTYAQTFQTEQFGQIRENTPVVTNLTFDGINSSISNLTTQASNVSNQVVSTISTLGSLAGTQAVHSASITALYLTNDNTSQVIYGLFQSNSVVKTAVDYLAETQSVHTTSIDELFTSNATLRAEANNTHTVATNALALATFVNNKPEPLVTKIYNSTNKWAEVSADGTVTLKEEVTYFGWYLDVASDVIAPDYDTWYTELSSNYVAISKGYYTLPLVPPFPLSQPKEGAYESFSMNTFSVGTGVQAGPNLDYVMNGHYTPGTFEPNLSVWAPSGYWASIMDSYVNTVPAVDGYLPLNGYTFILYEASGGPIVMRWGKAAVTNQQTYALGGFVTTNKAEMSSTYLPASSRDLVTKGFMGDFLGTNKVDRLYRIGDGKKWVEIGQGTLTYKEVTDGFYFNVYIFGSYDGPNPYLNVDVPLDVPIPQAKTYELSPGVYLWIENQGYGTEAMVYWPPESFGSSASAWDFPWESGSTPTVGEQAYLVGDYQSDATITYLGYRATTNTITYILSTNTPVSTQDIETVRTEVSDLRASVSNVETIVIWTNPPTVGTYALASEVNTKPSFSQMTNAIFYNPVITYTPSVTSTVTVIPSVNIYRVVSTGAVTTVVFDKTAISATSNNIATWETWIDFQYTNTALTLVLSGVTLVSPVDITCFGEYRFAMEYDGVTVKCMQKYPTCIPYNNRISSIWSQLTAATNAVSGIFSVAPPDVLTVSKLLMKFNTLTNTYEIYNAAYTKYNMTANRVVLEFTVSTQTKVVTVCDIYTLQDILWNQAYNVGPGLQFKKTGTDNITTPLYTGYSRPANELEIRAYALGWRPFN